MLSVSQVKLLHEKNGTENAVKRID
jgi:hypothetical protein